MREIRFRAWDGERMYENIGIDPFNKDYYVFNEEGAVFADFGTRPSIMQYVGITDKNGKAIYEGDVLELVRDGAETQGVVTYLDGAFYILDNHSKTCIHFFYKISKLTVVGNVHENPEMGGAK